jgi:hypothetical protein
VGSAAVTGVLVIGLVVLLGAGADDGGTPAPDPSFMTGLIMVIVLGLIGGALAGAIQHGVATLFHKRGRLTEIEPPISPTLQARLVDPWAEPVERSRESVRALTRLLDSLPPTAAGEWLGRIAATMSANLGDVAKLADAGRAAIPADDERAIAEIKQHPLYALLQKSADEFADVVAQINRMTVELHTPAGLAQIRTQLQVMAEQLPLLGREPRA